MAFIQKHHRIFGHVICQGAGWVPRLGARQVPGVVFDAFAMPHFGQHFQIETGSLLQALCFHQFAHANQLTQALGQLQFDGFNGCQNLVAGCDIVTRWVDREPGYSLSHAPGQWVQQF